MTKPGESDPQDSDRPDEKRPEPRPPVVSGTTGKVIPPVVRWGFYLMLAAALVGVLGSVWWLLDKDALIELQTQANEEREDPLTREQIVQGVTNLLWILMIINVIFGAFLTLFAWKAKEGLRRARMQLLIATVIIAMFHFVLVQTPHGFAAALFAAIGVALLYLPAVGDYYPPRQPAR